MAEAFLASYIKAQNEGAGEIYTQYFAIVKKLETKVTIQEEQLQAFLKKHDIISIESETNLKFQQMNDLELKLLEKKMTLTSLDMELTDIAKLVKNMDPDSMQSYVITASSHAAITSLEAQVNYMREKFTDENPKVKSLLDRLQRMKKEVASEKDPPPASQKTFGPNAIKESFQIRALNAEMEKKSVSKDITKLENTIIGFKEKLLELAKINDPYLQLKIEINAQKDMLEKMNLIVAESKILMESKICDFTVLEKAITPKVPVPGKKKLLGIAVVFLGGALTFVLVAIFVFLDFSFKSTSEIKDILDVPAIGNIPDKDTVASSIYSPAYQIFFDNLNNYVEKETKPTTIIFASDTEEAGKSFIIEQVTQQFIKQGKKILYIDSIKQNGEVDDALINQLLFESASRESIKLRTVNDSLKKAYFLTDNKSLAEIIDKNCISYLKNIFPEFDLIIWETFNCGENIQMFCNITYQADLTVFVLAFGKSNRTKVKSIVDFLKNKGITGISAVLNRVDQRYYSKEV